MTPVEHALCGAVVGNIIHPFIKDQTLSKRLFYFVIVISAMLPDIDFISRIDTAYYDNTVDNIMLSHRGFTHSILGALLLSILFVYPIYFVIRKKNSLIQKNFLYKLIGISFIGNLLHLICDLPTPSMVWNGIPVFFPLKVNGEYLRNGGWDLMGWYDFFIMYLFLFGVLVTPIIRRFSGPKSVIIFNAAIIVIVCIYIANCEYHSELSFDESERLWFEHQLRILPDWLVYFTENFRRSIGIFLFYTLPGFFRG